MNNYDRVFISIWIGIVVIIQLKTQKLVLEHFAAVKAKQIAYEAIAEQCSFMVNGQNE